MEQLNIKDKISSLFQKYKFAILIILIGVVLMLIPSFGGETASAEKTSVSRSSEMPDAETKLESILERIDGAGRVEVMLTVASGERTVYQSDTSASENEGGYSQNSDTVIVTDANRKEAGLVTQVNPPVYLGAIIVCEGADDPAVRLNIVEAVSKATGLGADKISVLKMK